MSSTRLILVVPTDRDLGDLRPPQRTPGTEAGLVAARVGATPPIFTLTFGCAAL